MALIAGPNTLPTHLMVVLLGVCDIYLLFSSEIPKNDRPTMTKSNAAGHN